MDQSGLKQCEPGGWRLGDDTELMYTRADSIGISDKGLFWGRWPLTALSGHLMNLVGPFLALKKKKMLV